MKQAILSVNTDDLKNYGVNKRIQWIFNPPGAPHMGVVWERRIRTVKSALYIIWKSQVPHEEVLITVLAEVEHTVNSRPITKMSVDPEDDETLTPNHFLIGSSSGEIRFNTFDPRTFNHRKQWRIVQHLADAFWKR